MFSSIHEGEEATVAEVAADLEADKVRAGPVVYVSGEENNSQVAARAGR